MYHQALFPVTFSGAGGRPSSPRTLQRFLQEVLVERDEVDPWASHPDELYDAVYPAGYAMVPAPLAPPSMMPAPATVVMGPSGDVAEAAPAAPRSRWQNPQMAQGGTGGAGGVWFY